uniref:Cleavage/polyadenylation specificity factor A subunit C-terminal domain-containing protein n=1 Tax=Trypanosoma vivax (strain Y486) TaxID=1055687 RepID=G0TZF2_TRYVY|nr:conserved hypothetical protein, fragment [Trypanosoma vivax Y486]
MTTRPPSTQNPAPAPAAVLRHPKPNMDLIYHQTIIPTQKISHCVSGTFTVPGASDFVVVRHDRLELWTLHSDRNVTECVHSTRLFANILQVATVPTVAVSGNKGGGILDSPQSHYSKNNSGGSSSLQRLVVTSETGTMVLLRYDLDELPVPTHLTKDPSESEADAKTAMATGGRVTSLRGRFVRVSEVDLGRSGARLTVPGARIAADPLGRAVFVTALMHLKVVVPLRKNENYHLSRDDDNVDINGNNESLFHDSSSAAVDDDLLSRPTTGAGYGDDGSAGVKKLRHAPQDVISFGSPVEAHRQTIIYSICALEGVTENATFATLEQELPEAKQSSAQNGENTSGVSAAVGGRAFLRVNREGMQHRGAAGSGDGTGCRNRSKQLVVYAFAAGLQQVQRTHLVHVPATAHRLIAVPADPFGPGGVLVCTDSEIIWYDLLLHLHSNSRDTRGIDVMHMPNPMGSPSLFKSSAPFPRRDDFREQLYDPMIISHASTSVRNDFFMLLQDEQGDIFRVSLTIADVQRSYNALRSNQQRQVGILDTAPPSAVIPSPLTITYFDTIPPTTTMVLFRRGFVFAASESAPAHGLYKIIKDGYKNDAEYVLSRMRMVEQRPAGGQRNEKHEEETGNSDSNEEETVGGNGHSTSPGANDSSATAAVGSGEDGNKTQHSGPVLAMPPPSALSKAPSAATPSLPVLQKPSTLLQQQNSRVVPLFHPHQALRHMVLLESYPSTPAITSFIVSIPQGQKQQQQPQLQIDAVVGRGSDSTLLHARYGYAARLENSFMLPAVFTHLMSLASASAMQERWLEVQKEVVTGSGRSRSSVKKVSRGTCHTLWDDKLLLSTRQGTTVLSLALTGQVEPDTLSGFITSEHTIAAGTLRYGVGYVQVTPSCILVLPYHHEPQEQLPESARMGVSPIAESMTWMDPHGKRIIAADVSGNIIVVSFAQGGGIASFDMGLSGTRLQRLEAIPNFPHAPAISVLRDPDSDSNMFSTAYSRAPVLSSASSLLTLAAIATASSEVFIVNPKKLREPLETIRCGQTGANTDGGDASNAASPPIVSVLLTYLGRAGGARRLFCFIGHMDGTVTRCELDQVTCKVIDRAVLTCGSAPCQLIVGDGEFVCYILCGEFNWRCEVRDGVPKAVPWRFPVPQTMYATFRRPPAHTNASTESFVPSGAREELVLGVAGNMLSLFAAGVASVSAETGLEYSFAQTSLSVAGRRLLQHPTRPDYLLVIGTEHRGYRMATNRRVPAADRVQRSNGDGRGEAGAGGIPLDKPQRSLNHPNYYVSTLQLYNRRSNRLDPPIYFHDGEAVLSAAVGSFLKDFGREPVVVLGCAEQYTHGSGLGVGASWGQGRLVAFRFVVSNAAVPNSPPMLRLEQLHETLLTAAPSSSYSSERANADNGSKAGSSITKDYASALHICTEVGLLFVGMSAENGLHVYAWGQRCFLRKRRLTNVPGRITAIETVFITPPGTASTTSSTLSVAAVASSRTYASDLYRCGPSDSNTAREKRLLIVCGTVDQSVFIATVQPSNGGAPGSSSTTSAGIGGPVSFLMLIARDTVPRGITSVACLDERTIAASDRCGNVVFLRSCPLHGGSGHPPYNIAGRLSMAPATFTSRVHNVVEGDYAQQLLHTSTTLFSKESRSELESEVGRRERTEGAQRNVLGLPKRSWPTLAELVAKQRALVALPP